MIFADKKKPRKRVFVRKKTSVKKKCPKRKRVDDSDSTPLRISIHEEEH